jgi:hypothetical protein
MPAAVAFEDRFVRRAGGAMRSGLEIAAGAVLLTLGR